ncbi:hypothetical protein J7384_19120 [Endozoicomonas sp. G2_1]|uniref:hypothetical protein n=1 Tax=Endozoicomonas sp. G2_1 TaxID=2821091 RepID=UPI001ADD41AC|nr:hypothetical protein [Endozoicomonas sp. G2_1]MBO9492467.1 hypothetical protein [Endozoicomonas sp. G2_1]
MKKFLALFYFSIAFFHLASFADQVEVEIHIKLSERGLLKPIKPQPPIENVITKIQTLLEQHKKVTILVSANVGQEAVVKSTKNKIIEQTKLDLSNFKVIYSS